MDEPFHGPRQRQKRLVSLENPYHSAFILLGAAKMREFGMRRAILGLSVLFGVVAMIALGGGNVRSQDQQSLIRICNNSDMNADAAVTGLQGGQYVIKGWWSVEAGHCTNTTYVGYGWVYLFAANFNRGVSWGGGGTPKRFCIVLSQMERVITPQFQCAPNLLKSFSGYFVESETATWNLGPVQ